MKAALLVLALLLSACSMRPVRTGAMIGPTWPHGVCDVVDTCWIVP